MPLARADWQMMIPVKPGSLLMRRMASSPSKSPGISTSMKTRSGLSRSAASTPEGPSEAMLT
ncbi:hypothetical protein D3C87_2116700 [compost metagenome]